MPSQFSNNNTASMTQVEYPWNFKCWHDITNGNSSHLVVACSQNAESVKILYKLSSIHMSKVCRNSVYFVIRLGFHMSQTYLIKLAWAFETSNPTFSKKTIPIAIRWQLLILLILLKSATPQQSSIQTYKHSNIYGGVLIKPLHTAVKKETNIRPYNRMKNLIVTAGIEPTRWAAPVNPALGVWGRHIGSSETLLAI